MRLKSTSRKYESTDSDSESDASPSTPSLGSDSEDSPPSDSSGDSSDSYSDTSSGSSGSLRRGRRHNRRKSKTTRSNRRKSKKRKSKKVKRNVKPISPSPYKGEPDADEYQHFMMQCTAYCKAGGIPKDEQVFYISNFLEGNALKFFIQKVAKNHSKWTLSKFFEGLFNYCFPLDYREQQRRKLRRCYQNGRRVSEYIHELENLLYFVGEISEREKVVKLWDGLSSHIRYELQRSKLSKDVHSWKKIARECYVHAFPSLFRDVPAHSETLRDSLTFSHGLSRLR
jgi:hypothetical protein